MKKALYLLIICALALSLSACGQKPTKLLTKQKTEESFAHLAVDYDVIECSYEDNNVATDKVINIKYPQIRKMIANSNNKAIETIINERIKGLVLSELSKLVLSSKDPPLTEFEGLGEASYVDKGTLEAEYTVTLQTNTILSVRFIVTSFHQPQAYPLIGVRTINFDMHTGKTLELNDIVNVDSNFRSSFFDTFSNQRKYDERVDDEFYDSINEYAKGILSIKSLRTCDEESSVDFHSYLTTDTVGISIAVPFGGGSYALYEAKYSDVPLRTDFKELLRGN